MQKTTTQPLSSALHRQGIVRQNSIAIIRIA